MAGLGGAGVSVPSFRAGRPHEYRERVIAIGCRETLARAAQLRALHAGWFGDVTMAEASEG